MCKVFGKTFTLNCMILFPRDTSYMLSIPFCISNLPYLNDLIYLEYLRFTGSTCTLSGYSISYPIFTRSGWFLNA